MGYNDAAIDRLLPRHFAGGIALEWCNGIRRSGLRRSEEWLTAEIVDLSLEGALLEVPGEPTATIGDKVRLRSGDVETVALVRHRREPDGPRKAVLFGVRFGPERAWCDLVTAAVGDLRGKKAELEQAWSRQN